MSQYPKPSKRSLITEPLVMSVSTLAPLNFLCLNFGILKSTSSIHDKNQRIKLSLRVWIFLKFFSQNLQIWKVSDSRSQKLISSETCHRLKH